MPCFGTSGEQRTVVAFVIALWWVQCVEDEPGHDPQLYPYPHGTTDDVRTLQTVGAMGSTVRVRGYNGPETVDGDQQMRIIDETTRDVINVFQEETQSWWRGVEDGPDVA